MTLSPRPAPAVGAHVGADPIATASEHGFDIVQIFVGDPQAWKGHAVDHPGGAAGLKAEADAAGVGIYVHAPYVVNVATTNNRLRIPSRQILAKQVKLATELGARGVIVHGGHLGGKDDPAVGFDNWRKAVEGLELTVPLLIENTAGGTNAMARELDRIARLVRDLGLRLGIAAGSDQLARLLAHSSASSASSACAMRGPVSSTVRVATCSTR